MELQLLLGHVSVLTKLPTSRRARILEQVAMFNQDEANGIVATYQHITAQLD
jgi:hypothetical protein